MALSTFHRGVDRVPLTNRFNTPLDQGLELVLMGPYLDGPVERAGRYLPLIGRDVAARHLLHTKCAHARLFAFKTVAENQSKKITAGGAHVALQSNQR